MLYANAVDLRIVLVQKYSYIETLVNSKTLHRVPIVFALFVTQHAYFDKYTVLLLLGILKLRATCKMEVSAKLCYVLHIRFIWFSHYVSHVSYNL